MEPALLGLVLDASVLVAAERAKLTTPEAIKKIRDAMGDLPIAICSLTVAEIIARIGGEQAAKGINLPLADLIIGASALELGYAVVTSNLRDFKRIPDLTVIEL